MSAALSSPSPTTSPPAGSRPWFVAVGLRVWQGSVARALTLLLSVVLVAVVASIAVSVWLQGSNAGTAPSEQTLRLWTWAYSSGRVLTQWALVAPLVLVGATVSSLCATYVQAAPSLAMAKASGAGSTARFGWHVRRTDREGRRTLARDGVGVLLRRRGRWPLLVVGLLASLTTAVTTAAALGGGFEDLGMDPGLLPWLTLAGGLVGVVGFALLMVDGVLVAIDPQLQVTPVGDSVDDRGFAMGPPDDTPTAPAAPPEPAQAPAVAAQPEPQPVLAPPAPTGVAPATVERPTQPLTPTAAPTQPRRSGTAGDDLAGRLERLSALHRAGELDDDEFRAAKASLLSSR